MGEKPVWTVIKHYDLQGFAEMDKQLLEENNIPALLRKDAAHTVLGAAAGGVGSDLKLSVPEEFVEEALLILQQTAQGSAE